MIHGEYELFAGLDVSMNRTSVCVIDRSGVVIWRGACAVDPEALAATLHCAGVERSTRVGLETGSLSPWLVQGYTNKVLRRSAWMPGIFEPRFPSVPTRATTRMQRVSH